MKYSIIVPVYNGDKTVVKCLESINNQSFTDFECVIINDASTDDTEKVINEFIQDKPKFRLLNNPENVGVGVTRKVGVDNALGDFIIFVDSDDLILPQFLEISNVLQEQDDSDVVFGQIRVFYPEHYFSKDNPKAQDRLLSEEATVQPHFDSELKFLTGKVFRKTLFDKIEMSNKRCGEDVQTLFYLCYEAEKVRETSYHGYIHVFRKGSLLADAPFETCFVGSGMAEIEIIEYLLKKGNKKIAYYILCQLYVNYLKIRALVKKDKKVINKDILYSTLDGGWDVITQWVEDHLGLCVDAVKYYAELANNMKKDENPDTWVANLNSKNL